MKFEIIVKVDSDHGISDTYNFDVKSMPLEMTDSTRATINNYINLFQDENIKSLTVQRGSVNYQITKK